MNYLHRNSGLEGGVRLFDAHCHLCDERFRSDLDEVLARAGSEGVALVACCAAKEGEWAEVLATVARHECVVPSVGIHPWFTEGLSEGWKDRLVEILGENPEAGVGEIGLDHAIDAATCERQMEIFEWQLEIAREMDRPVSLHCRKAWGAMLDVLKRFGNFPAGFVVHAYSGSTEIVKDITDLGGYISFSGTVTRSGNKRAHKTVPAVPEDRLLIETDAPDMMPVFRDEDRRFADLIRGDRNEPCTLPLVVNALAGLRKTSVEEIARITLENGERLFGTG